MQVQRRDGNERPAHPRDSSFGARFVGGETERPEATNESAPARERIRHGERVARGVKAALRGLAKRGGGRVREEGGHPRRHTHKACPDAGRVVGRGAKRDALVVLARRGRR